MLERIRHSLSKKNFGEQCPVCDFASALWKEGVENNDDNAKREAKKLFVRKRYFSPILVRGEEQKGVRIWSYGKMAYETLLGLVLDPDYGDISDPETGTDIVLTYTVPGTPGSFPSRRLNLAAVPPFYAMNLWLTVKN